MKMRALVAMTLLALPLSACERNAESAPPAHTSAAAATVGEDAAIPKLAVGTKARCPVSGEEFPVKANTVQVTYNGKRYAFCCPDCQPTFAKNPAKYAKN